MCLILHHEPNAAPITREKIEDYVSHSPSGIGIWYMSRQRPAWIYGKDLSDMVARAMNVLRKREKNDQLFIHFRLVTSGAEGRAGVHPFPVLDHQGKLSYWLAHNGTMNDLGNEQESDSAHLARLLRGVDIESACLLLEQMRGQRFLLSDSSAAYRVGDWIEEDGVHYSNSYARTIEGRKQRWKDYFLPDYPLSERLRYGVEESIPRERPRSNGIFLYGK